MKKKCGVHATFQLADRNNQFLLLQSKSDHIKFAHTVLPVNMCKLQHKVSLRFSYLDCVSDFQQKVSHARESISQD